MNTKINKILNQKTIGRRSFLGLAVTSAAAVALLPACDLLSSKDKNEKSIEKTINDVLSGSQPLDTISIDYSIGMKFWQFGHTSMTIKGTGTGIINNITGSVSLDFSGTVQGPNGIDGPDQVKSVIQAMKDNKFWNLSRSRQNPFPDESSVTITISDSKNNLSQTVSFFENEGKSNSQFSAIWNKLDGIVVTMSAGKVR